MALEPLKLEPAILQEVWWNEKGILQEKGPQGQPGKKFTAQFNPQTLKVNFSNQKAGGDQPKGSSTQFVGKGVTKLTLELWFDISLAQAQGRIGAQNQGAGTGQNQNSIDVRSLTQQVAYFMKPQKVKGKKDIYVPPGVRFSWGTFVFDGVMDSMDETLDLFSSGGLPIRASVNISISRQEIIYDPSKSAALGDAPGVQPFEAIPSGKPLQQTAAEAGSDWRRVALANGIENPRMMSPGALVNLSAGVSVSGAASLGVDLSAGVQVGVSAGLSAQAGVGTSGGAQGGASAGAGAQFGFATSSASAGTSAQVSASVDVQVPGGFGGGV